MRLSQVVTDWAIDPILLVAVLTAAGAYLAGVRRSRRRWPATRSASFLGGLAVLLVASQSGIDAWSERLLSVHMVQHLLITMVAALLLVAGAPLTLALSTLPRPGRAALARLLHGRLAGSLGHPLVAWSVFASVLLVSHVPAVYGLALRSPSLHALEHALYLWAALLFWAPVVAADPLPRRLSTVAVVGYLLAAMAPMSAIGAALLMADGVAYGHYAATAAAAGVSPLDDQRTGAAIMWIGGGLVMVLATLGGAWVAMLREERRARAREAYEDARSARPAVWGGAR
jgi:putative membrane protein